jgi:hypothetical protein
VPYLKALATTLLLEVPVVALGYRGVAPRGRAVAVAAAANLATHGLLWAAWPWLPGTYLARLAGAELAVAAAEALAFGFLLGGSPRRAVAVSALANALSTAAGLALRRLAG